MFGVTFSTPETWCSRSHGDTFSTWPRSLKNMLPHQSGSSKKSIVFYMNWSIKDNVALEPHPSKAFFNADPVRQSWLECFSNRRVGGTSLGESSLLWQSGRNTFAQRVMTTRSGLWKKLWKTVLNQLTVEQDLLAASGPQFFAKARPGFFHSFSPATGSFVHDFPQ